MQLLKGKINPVCLGVLKDTIFLGVYTCKHNTHSPTKPVDFRPHEPASGTENRQPSFE